MKTDTLVYFVYFLEHELFFSDINVNEECEKFSSSESLQSSVSECWLEFA